jgi:hypothetical protein
MKERKIAIMIMTGIMIGFNYYIIVIVCVVYCRICLSFLYFYSY